MTICVFFKVCACTFVFKIMGIFEACKSRNICLCKKKIENKYNKNQGCQEKLNKGITKLRLIRKFFLN